MPAHDSLARSVRPTISYHAFIFMPPFKVTGRTLAVGNMNLQYGMERLILSATSQNPSPLSPKPWQKTTVALWCPTAGWIVMSPLVPSLSTRGAPNDAILFGKKIRERLFFAKEGCKRRRRKKETINCVETWTKGTTRKGRKRSTKLSRGCVEKNKTHTVQVARAAHHEKTQPRKLNFATTPTVVFVVVTTFCPL